MRIPVSEVIRKLTTVAENPGKAVKESCEKTGKRAVGFVAPYGPEEIAYAAGCLPVGLWGAQVELRRVRTYLPPFACSIMQSVVELAASGAYDGLAAVVISSPCDTLKCIGQKWKGKCPAIHFAHPMNRTIGCADDYLTYEYKTIRTKLEDILDVEITDEALSNAILLYNRYRALMREFTQVARDHLKTISPRVRHNIMKASYFMDKAEYMTYIDDLIYGLRKEGAEIWNGKKVILSGITFEPAELLGILEFYNVAVCGDDLAHESRQFRTDVPYHKSPLQALAAQWQNQSACSLAFDPFKSRVQHLLDLVRSTRADGLVIGVMKFCDPEEYDVPILMEAFEKAGIPLLCVEVDQQSTAFEQIKTRIQGFVESL